MNIFEAGLVILILLQIKHWYVDFVDQTNEEVISKGIYGDAQGIAHSAKQGLGTLFALLAVTGVEFFFYVALLAVADAVIHYHIDWSKINLNKKYNYTVENPKFWMWLGADQLAHQLTYIWIVWVVCA